jgi:hypothetical protein
VTGKRDEGQVDENDEPIRSNIYLLPQLVGCPSTLSLSPWDSGPGEEATSRREMKRFINEEAGPDSRKSER